MVDRIKKLMELKKMSPTQFADEIEVQRSSLSHVLSGRNKPSLDFMLKIKNAFPDINLDWLLLDEGSIYNKKNEKWEIDQISPEKQQQVELTFSTENEQEEITGNEKENIGNPEQGTRLPGKIRNGKQPVRVIMFYSDNSFETFEPRQ
jgi:transcriptional regulator with XRE-family HTH domain